MTTLDRVPEEMSPVHLLLVARTKFGKSTYAARAAKKGYRLLYIDSDNGISALQNTLRDDVEAQRRVNYFHTESPYLFLKGLFNASGFNKFRWVIDQDKEFVRMGNYTDSNIVVEIDLNRIPRSVVFDIDSWTSLAADAMELGAKARNTDVIEMGDKQGVYGEANTRLTWIANQIQKRLHCHCIVQAHDTVYEIYEKPTGQIQKDIKQKDMILRDVIQIPVSSSRPHGLSLGKQFSYIGWLDINLAGEVSIDFRRSSNRVGGGPPNTMKKISELPFERLVDPVNGQVPPDPGTDGWLRYIPALELQNELGAKKEQVAVQGVPNGQTATRPVSTTTPASTSEMTAVSPRLKSGLLGKLQTAKRS